MGREVYIQICGKMYPHFEPQNPEKANFVITYKGKDWSGFQTLAECKKQFPELEKRSGDYFAVVER